MVKDIKIKTLRLCRVEKKIKKKEKKFKFELFFIKKIQFFFKKISFLFPCGVNESARTFNPTVAPNKIHISRLFSPPDKI